MGGKGESGGSDGQGGGEAWRGGDAGGGNSQQLKEGGVKVAYITQYRDKS